MNDKIVLPVPEEERNNVPAIDLSLLEQNNQKRYVGKQAESMALKVALGSKNEITFDDAYHKLQQGGEDVIRDHMFRREQMRQENRRTTFVNEYLKNRDPNKPVSPQELAAIEQVSVKDLEQGPDHLGTVIERNFARELVNSGIARNPKLATEVQKDEVNLDRVDAAEEHLVKSQIAGLAAQRAQDVLKEQGWVPFLFDVAKSIIPGYDWAKTQNAVPNLPSDGGIVPNLPGTTRQEQILYLFGLPAERMKRELDAAVDALIKDNPQLAARFANEIYDYSRTQAQVDNIFGALDAVDVALTGAAVASIAGKSVSGAARSAGRGVRKGSEYVTETLKALGREASSPNPKVENLAAAVGDIDTAAAIQAQKITIARTGSKSDPEALKALYEEVTPSLLNPSKILATNPGRLSVEAAKDISSRLEASAATLAKAIHNPMTVSRVLDDTQSWNLMVRNLADEMKKYHNIDLSNGILDIRAGGITKTNNADDILDSSRVSFDLGRTDKSTFDDARDADAYARLTYNLKPGDYEINQEGANYFITVQRTLNEKDPSVRAHLIEGANTPPKGGVKGFLGSLLSADILLAKQHNAVRKQTTFAAEEIEAVVKEATKRTNKFFQSKAGKEAQARLSRIMEHDRDFLDPKTKERGRFLHTAADFQTEYHRLFNEYPSDREIEAYFTMRQINDLDYISRNTEMYAYKASRGVRSVELEAFDPNTKTRIRTKPFEGVPVDKLPSDLSTMPHRLMVVENGTPRFYNTRDMDKKGRDALVKSLENDGYKFIRVFDPQRSGLSKYDPNSVVPVNFVASKDVRLSNINVTQIPYRDGWHVVYDNQAYIKQGQVLNTNKGKFYIGEKVFSGHNIAAEGKNLLPIMETARLMLQRNDANLDTFVARNLGMSPKQFRNLFKGKDGFKLDEPFQFVENNVNIKNNKEYMADKIDLTDSRFSMADEMNTRFASEKGQEIFSFEQGSAQRPFKPASPSYVDPMKVLNNTMQELVESRVFSNYKIRSAEEFIAAYGHLMDVRMDDLRAHPMYHIRNPTWVKETAENKNDIKLAQKALIAIQNLTSQPSAVSEAIRTAKYNAVQSIYGIKGKQAAEMADDKLAYVTNDPSAFFRSVATHMSLGLFNPVHLMLQVQSAGNAVAIGGAKYLPQIMKDMTSVVTASWNPNRSIHHAVAARLGSDKEFVDFAMNSGFFRVAGGHVLIDHVGDAKMFSSKAGDVLDAGMIFWKTGEKFNRTVALSLAYRTIRGENPGMPLNAAMRERIIGYADDLLLNMTRASNADIQNGIGSIPLQFWSYQWRMAEAFWRGATGGGGLSKKQAWGMFAWNSALYGLPVGVAVPTAIWPFYESLQVYAEQNGLNFQSGYFDTLLSTGLSGLIGPDWAFSERYGPGGIPTLREVFTGEKGLEVLAGVSGQTMNRLFSASAPVATYLANTFYGDPMLKAEDILDIASTVSSVSLATRAWMAYNYGLYQSKSGLTIKSGEDGLDAGLAAIFGLQPRDLQRYYSRREVLTHQDKVLRELRPLIQKEIGRALKENDPKESEQYWVRARALLAGVGTLSQKQKDQLLLSVIKPFGMERLDEVNLKWLQRAPSGQILDNRTRTLQQQQN